MREEHPHRGGTDVAPVAHSSVDHFDHHADVVVVGGGCAGLSAAIAAAVDGASVILVERAGAAGGSSALSGGELYLGGGTRLQQDCGFEDGPTDMYAYLSRALGPHADEEKLRLYCEGSVAHFDWLESLGVPFKASLHDTPTWMPFTEDGLMWLGENASPFLETARAVPRGHRPAAPGFGGRVLMDVMTTAGAGVGVETHTDTRAHALIVDQDGRVTGLEARRFGALVRYRARRAVVLTTGGFVDNETMLCDHAPALLGHGKVSDGLDDGSGIMMATAAGAATRRLAAVQAALAFVPLMACHGMIVNAHGERFINEDVYPGRFSQAALHQPGPWWVVLDEAGYDAMTAEQRMGVEPRFGAESATELARELGMPQGALERTLELYNEGARAGEDRVHHKAARWLRELTPPLAAFAPMRAGGPHGLSGFTLGGLRTDVDGRVQHVAGHPIRGLFAAGRAASGIHGDGYVSGTSLGDGTFFGRRAGRAAAAAG
jgi:3-oxo-5alpha-steroid 4-dehydrogenase